MNEMRAYGWNAVTSDAGAGRASILPQSRRIRAVSNVSNGGNVSWDPEGLFKNQSKVSLFTDRESSEGEPGTTSSAVPPLEASFSQRHPIRPLKKEGTLSDLKRFKSMLADRYMPVNFDQPNVRILHIDPPIFLVDEVCLADRLPLGTCLRRDAPTHSPIGLVNHSHSFCWIFT